MGTQRERRAASIGGAGVVLVAGLLLMLTVWGQSATALSEEFDLPAGTSASADPAEELDVFQTFDDVRSLLNAGTAFGLPLSWIPGASSFGIDSGTIVVEPDEHRIQILSTPGSASKFSAGFWLMLDWDNGSVDSIPELTAGFKVENLPIEDLNNLFDFGTEVPIALNRGWVLFSSVATSDTIITYTIDELPPRVLAFLGNATPNPAISADTPLELAVGANFIAEIDLTQARPLKQTIALAGVTEIDLVLRGTLSSDASSLFGDGDPASLLQFQMAATLDAIGTDAPEWLTGRTFDIEFGFDDIDNPFIGIGDQVETFVGDASNTFKRGVRFDPNFFDGLDPNIPLLLRFDLVGAPREPFEIDLAGLLGVTSVDQISAAFILGINLDLTLDDPVTAIDVSVEFIFGTTTITMKIDTDPSGTAFGIFSIEDPGTLSQLADRLSAVFGVPSPDLDPIGQLGVPDVVITAKKILGTNSVNLKATIDVYDNVFGVQWLDLDSLALDITLSNRTQSGGESIPSIFGSLSAEVDLAGRPWTATVGVKGSLQSDQVSIEGSISLSLADGAAIAIGPVVELVEQQFPGLPDIPTELASMSLRDIELALTAERSPSGFEIAFDAFAVTTVPVLNVDAAMYLRTGLATDGAGGTQVLFDLGLRPLTPTNLADLVQIPGLSDDPSSSPELPAFAFVVTTGTSKTPSGELTPAGFEFYKGLYGCESTATTCRFFLDLKPGVNLVANLAAFPEVVDPLIEALWMNPDQGLQFIGRLPFFGVGGDVGIDLQIRLPEIVPPPEVDFLTGGRLAVGVKAGTGGIETYIQGQLDTRWRRSDANPGSCVGIGGELQSGFDQIDDDTIVENEYCYDVLNFQIDAGLSLSTGGLKVKLSGGVIAPAGFGWEEPFGLPGITIRSLKLAIEVGFEPPSSLSFAGGFAGDIIIGDPNAGGKQFFGSAAAGFAIVPAPTPAGVTIVPKFVGVRGYVSSIGMTDVARIWEFLFPDAPSVQDLTGFPLAELRNAEFMLALGDNEALCLTTGVFLAGELYLVDELSAPGPVPVPPTNEQGCAPFGALVDPDTCLSDDPLTGRRDDGCFATFFGQLALSGIVADGRVGALDLGPVHFDDAQLTFKLTPAEQSLVIRGGMHIVDPALLGGELALRVGLTDLDFYGRVTAFGGFLAEVEGGYSLGLEAPFTPTFDMSTHVVLGADFDAAFRAATEPVLRSFSDMVATTDAIYNRLKATGGDPFETLRQLPADLAAAGVGVPGWYDNSNPAAVDLLTALDAIAELMTAAEIESPSMDQLFAGITFDKPFTLPGFEAFDTCYAAPFVEGTVVDGVCYSVYIDGIPGIGDLVSGAPTSFTQFLDDVAEPALSQALQAVGLPAGVTFGDLSDSLIERLQGLTAPVSLTCIDFDFDTAAASPSVALRMAGQIFGAPFGLDVGWNFDDAIAPQASALAADLISQLFVTPAESACAPIGPLDGALADASDAIADTTFEPSLSAGSIIEGDEVTLGGTYGDGLADSDSALVSWGDGTSAESTTVAALRAGLPHTYVDDDPTGTSADTVLVTVTIGDVSLQTALRVVNDRPSGLVLDVADRVNEGTELTLEGTFSDAGTNDDFEVSVSWDDGSSSGSIAVVAGASPGTWSFSATHTYADDDPSLTPFDAMSVQVTVTDDDLGTARGGAVVIVDDVAPSNIAIVAILDTDETIEEGLAVTYRVSWTDPGDDEFAVVVDDFGDGNGTTVFSTGRSVDISHVYADDDPTLTSVDAMTVRVRVIDDDLLTGAGQSVFDVYNVDPVVTVAGPSGGTTISVQYSDPIGGWIDDDGSYGVDPVVISAYDVTADTSDPGFGLTATIVEQGSGNVPSGLPGWLNLGSPTCTADPASQYHSTCTWQLSAVVPGAVVPGAAPYIHTNLPPGTYEVLFTVTDDDTGADSATFTIEVLPEDARVWYVGPTFAATDSATDGDVNVDLRATVRDISSVPGDPLTDPWPGDIRTAELSFVNRDTAPDATFPCARADDPPVDVDEVFSPFDVFDAMRSIGVGTCDWLATVAEADPYTVGSIVGGNYARNNSTDDTVVTVARPLDEFITGGGYLVLSNSAGDHPGDFATHANYGFNVKFNKKGTKLQGRATIIFRIGDRTYQIKSNAIDSLGVYPGSDAPIPDDFLHAEFEAKANLIDVTDSANPISVAGNLVLQMRMTDASDDGATDTIAFTLWDIRRQGNGKNAIYTQLLEFSSNWDGNETQEQTIAGGNILVHD